MLRRTRTPLHDYEAQRIAIVKPSALGDIIHSLPVLTALRQRYPKAHIAWVVNKSYEPLLQGHPDLNATLPFDRAATRGGLRRAVAGYASFFRAFRREQFDLVVDLQGLLRSALMVQASRAARRVGLSTAREGAPWFYTDVVRVADFNAIHAVDRYWLIAEAFGVGKDPKQFRFPTYPAADRWADEMLSGHARPWIFLGVGSRWETKRWLPQHFAHLARRAQAEFGGTVFFIGSPDEQEISQTTARLLAGPSVDFTGRTKLPELAALLARADVMAANDTGPLHLAAALGRPVVAPYTCTSILLNGPYGGEAGALETDVWCKASYITKCKRLECMSDLTPDRLWPLLRGILDTWQSNRRSA